MLKKLKVVAAVCAVCFGLTSCGLHPSTSTVPNISPGSLQPVAGAEGDKIVITSKNFTEQLVLGKIAVLTAKAAGFNVTDMTNVPGSVPTRNLMTSGQADLTFEYTGTTWITYLNHEDGIPDQKEQWEAVKKEDKEKNNLVWENTAPLNNTYAFAVRSDYAKEHNISKLSDIEKVPVAERTLCVESELNSRKDGLNPMLERYGIPRGSAEGIPESNISIMDTGTVYQATYDGSCNFGEIYMTDGRIQSLNLVPLEDDRHFFPAYNAAPVFNASFIEKHPELADRFAQVVPLLDDDTMRSLNLKVDVEGQDPGQVAYDWMESKGFIGK